jgi:hypothetical protein
MWLDKADKPRSAGGIVADRYFRAQMLDRLVNDELTRRSELNSSRLRGHRSERQSRCRGTAACQ